MKVRIISIDELKKSLPGYSPDKADDFHVESAKIANKLFDEELKSMKRKQIVLMCGGSASGKSEFIEKFFTDDFEGLVFDSTLSSIEGTEIKIKHVLKSDNVPVLCLVLPENNDFKRCFAAFNKRDRRIQEIRFYETHSGSRKVALWIARQHPDIEILIFQNSYQPKNKMEDHLSFSVIRFGNKKEMLDFLEKTRYSEEEIRDMITKN